MYIRLGTCSASVEHRVWGQKATPVRILGLNSHLINNKRGTNGVVTDPVTQSTYQIHIHIKTSMSTYKICISHIRKAGCCEQMSE